jgi:hypothetical protein
MTRYWWVNHKQTFKQEINGGYLWSPKREANGVRSQFYENMRLAAPNNLVLSFAHSRIAYVGRVTDFALSAPKPLEFASAGANWDEEGWLLPIHWHPLGVPVRPKEIISRLAQFLPEKYSPISSQTGNGNQKAYLAEISSQAFQIVMEFSGNEGSGPAHLDGSISRSADFKDVLETRVEELINGDLNLSSSEKVQLIKARRGQGIFRDNVSRVENACRVTGITNRRLLIASHIKPWRSCADSMQRLDGYNGLMLTPNVDLLFDRGFISFTNDGQILKSHHIDASEFDRLGVFDFDKPKAFLPKQHQYLQHHRESVFLG